MPKWLDKVLGVEEDADIVKSEEVYQTLLKEIQAQPLTETVEKGMKGKPVAYMQPIIGDMSVCLLYTSPSPRD